MGAPSSPASEAIGPEGFGSIYMRFYVSSFSPLFSGAAA
tara:strand:- start:1101 stop:1217 length:117 start_codon:yes stop_codon:yes gene_type:complete